MPDTTTALEENFPVVVFCPICCTSQDHVMAAGTDGVLSTSCGSCDTEFQVTVVPAKVLEHSIS